MCNYCGCREIRTVGRFMSEHEDLVNFTGDLYRARESGDPAAVARALEQLDGLLHPHTHAEERGLFTVLRRNPEFTDHVDGLCAEHTGLEAMAQEIRNGDFDVVDEFIDALREHMDKEDNGLFPAAAIELEGPDWEEVVALTQSADTSPLERAGEAREP
ncbi:hemerythrin [Intrasporangium chromatireducens Q5-1]|uniref:Hemerythrin n=2 Tax=Intrasporangium TaxID=53357 RepID=W9GKG5_9MICO|nr:hemerythrin [Intrasporangium chromatireducens Q5-1]